MKLSTFAIAAEVRQQHREPSSTHASVRENPR